MDTPQFTSGPFVLGTVPYLNVQPITWAIEAGLVAHGQVEIQSSVPRRLAADLRAGKFHAAIVPVFEYIQNSRLYTYLDAPVIAARGQVLSVALYATSPWETLHTVYLDSSSYTSVNLFKVLAAEKGYNHIYIDTATQRAPYPLPAGTGWVVIGDPAIAEVGQHAHAYDLAAEWAQLTGLPFVFAAWIAPAGDGRQPLENLLAESLAVGRRHWNQLVEDSAARFNMSPHFVADYFSNYIHYHLGPNELSGWKLFADYCVKHKLVEHAPEFRPDTLAI